MTAFSKLFLSIPNAFQNYAKMIWLILISLKNSMMTLVIKKGDEVLGMVAEILKGNIRTSDTAFRSGKRNFR